MNGVEVKTENTTQDFSQQLHRIFLSDRDPCPIGAAYWLYAGGVCYLVTTIFLFMLSIITNLGGYQDSCPLKLAVVGLVMMEFAILIWGSVRVFGAYKDWTYDVEEYSENFCEYTPMMFAFVILIMKWVRSEENNINKISFLMIIDLGLIRTCVDSPLHIQKTNNCNMCNN